MNPLLPCLLVLVGIPVTQSDTWIAVAVNSGDQSGIYVVSADGSDFRQLTNGAMDILPAWSRDGRSIAFLALREQDHELAAKHDFAFHWFLYVMDADGRNQHRVTTTPVGGIFQWSPDGSKFLIQSSYEDPDNQGKDGSVSSAIYVMNADGSGQQRLTPAEGFDLSPTWSPDGSQIAFCSDRNGNMDIFVMNADGSRVRNLTSDSADESNPVWSNDGKRIAFSSNRRRENGSVYTINIDGRGERWISDDEDPLAWSLDNSKLFLSNRDQIFVTGVDGQERRRLTSPEGRALDAIFSPHDNRVFFRWQGNGGCQIYSVAVNGNGSKRVSDLTSVSSFSVSPIKK